MNQKRASYTSLEQKTKLTFFRNKKLKQKRKTVIYNLEGSRQNIQFKGRDHGLQ